MPAIPYVPSDTEVSDFASPTKEKDCEEYGIPAGFPQRYEHERVWIGSEIQQRPTTWTLLLDDDDRKAVAEGLKKFQDLKLHASAISAETFPLPPGLSQRLKDISHTIHNGCGFTIVKGLDPDSFTEEENTLVLGGISAHVASRRGFQDTTQESVVCHVVSEDLKPYAERVSRRPAFTNGVCSFHTDVGDILALYAKGVPEKGGETYLASSSQTYNELAASKRGRRLLHELVRKWTFYHSQDFQLDGAPLLHTSGKNLVFNFSRIPVTGFGNEGPSPTLPAPTAIRLEAMEAVNRIMTNNRLKISWEPGDILYFNNLCLMHARDAFDLGDNGESLRSKRHLIKLVLRDPDLMWEVPTWLQKLDNHVYPDGNRSEYWRLRHWDVPTNAEGSKFFGGGGDDDDDDCSKANG